MKTIIINRNEVTEDTSIWLTGTSVRELNDVLYKALVPSNIKRAPTTAGEKLRKCNSTIYRFLNDGDIPIAWRRAGVAKMSDPEATQFLFDYFARKLYEVCASRVGKQVLADAGVTMVFED